MAHIEVIAPGEAGEELAAVYEEVEHSRGAVANILAIHSLLPETMETHMDLYKAIQFSNAKGGLSRRERELLAVVVSAVNGCAYCVGHHSDALERYLEDAELVEAIGEDWDAAVEDPGERALCTYAEKLTRDPANVGAEDVEALRQAGYGDVAILQAALTTSYFNFVNRIALGLGVEDNDRDAPYDY